MDTRVPCSRKISSYNRSLSATTSCSQAGRYELTPVPWYRPVSLSGELVTSEASIAISDPSTSIFFHVQPQSHIKQILAVVCELNSKFLTVYCWLPPSAEKKLESSFRVKGWLEDESTYKFRIVLQRKSSHSWNQSFRSLWTCLWQSCLLSLGHKYSSLW